MKMRVRFDDYDDADDNDDNKDGDNKDVYEDESKI